MKKNANWVFTITLVLGVAGFWAYANQVKKEAQGGAMQDVLVVNRDLEAGDSLTEADLHVTKIPEDYLDARRILRTDRKRLLGVALTTRIRAGEGLVWSDLADGAAHRNLASLIAPGHRAYSLSPGANPLGRLLHVGDHVDVLLESNGVSQLLLERVLILAAGGKIEGEDELLGARVAGAQGVTLSLSSNQAQRLFAAESKGDVRLVLRNPKDLRKRNDRLPTMKAQEKKNSKMGASFLVKKEIEHVR